LFERKAEAAGYCEFCFAVGVCPTGHAGLGCTACSGTYGYCMPWGGICFGVDRCPGVTIAQPPAPCYCVPKALYDSC
jgi:hypothetical protein